jgi:DICT domain-containing protein
VAASSLPAIEAGIASETAELDPFASDRGPDVLAAIDGDVYGAVDMDKQSLIDASTAIEMTAWRVGGGEFHAGFQKLSRCFASPRSRRVMRRLADAGVDVHVYGEPDVVPEPDHRNLTAHPDRSREIARSWFVAYDGDGDPDRQAALVVQEDGEQRYHGFWTYEAGVARAVVAYVADTYLGAAEREAAA